jgi:hypothetical protein
MQITFDHNDLANPDTLAILRRIVAGSGAQLGGVSNLDIPKPAPAPAPYSPGLAEIETPPAPEMVERALEMAAERAALADLDAQVVHVAADPVVTLDGAPLDVSGSDLLDSAGNMWDARIHASTRTKISDGTWKLKRGVDPQLIAQVLGGASKVEAFAAAVDPATIGFGASEPVAPPPPAAPAPVAADGWPVDLLGPHEPGREFAAFMRYVMQLTTSGASTQALLACCKEHGVGSFGEVNGRTDIMPALARALSLVSTNKEA